MAMHLLFFAIETIGLFAVVLLGSRLIVSAPALRNVQLAALICLNAACARLLARQEYASWIPAPYDIDVGVLFLSAGTDGGTSYGVVADGARGYLSKKAGRREICEAIEVPQHGARTLVRESDAGTAD